MTILYHSALRRPRRTILVAALLLVAAAPGLLLLELGTDGRALVPRDAPAVRVDERIRAEFPAEDPIAVVIEASTPQGILSEGNLRLIRRLTEDLRALEGIDSSEVVSLATETGGRVRPGTLEFTSFLDPIPEGDERLEALRRDLHALPIYHGTLVSSDGGEELAGWSPSAAAILLGVPAGADRTLLHRRIVDTVSRLGEIPERIHVVGAPVAEALLGRHILHDLALLVPLVIAAMGLVFLLAFGTPAAAWPPLLEVGAAMVFVFGLIGYCGVPVYLTIAVLPVILSAIGVTDEIHIFSRYRRLLRERQHPAGHVEALRAALDDVWRPIVKTSVTSSIGFLSFTLSPVAPVRAFGVFTAAGIIFCMLWSLTVIPAILSLQDPRRFAAAGRSRSPQGEAPVEALVRLAIRFRWAVLAALAVALAAAPIGLRGLVVQDSWIDNFSPRSELRRSTERVNRLFSGVHSLRILVDARGAILSGDLAPHASEDPRSGLAELLTLEPDPAHRAGLDRWIGRRVVVQASPAAAGSSPSPSSSGGSTGLLDSREPLFTAQAIEVEQESGRARLILRRDDDPQLRPSRSRHLRDLSYSVAGTPLLDPHLIEEIGAFERFLADHPGEEVGGVLGLANQLESTHYLEWRERRIGGNARVIRHLYEQYGRIRGRERLEELIDDARQRCLITLFLKNANFVDTARLLEEIRRYEKERLSPLGLELSFAGDVAVSQAMIEGVVETQTRSLGLTLAGALLVSAFLGRSLIWGILCVLPAALAVIANLTLLGLLDIPLGIATSMFSAISIGIGVDYAIHFLERCRRPAGARAGAGMESVLAGSAAEVAPPILVDACALAAGFGMLLLSQVPSTGRLGLLVISSLATCLVTTLLVLPPLVRILRPRFLGADRS